MKANTNTEIKKVSKEVLREGFYTFHVNDTNNLELLSIVVQICLVFEGKKCLICVRRVRQKFNLQSSKLSVLYRLQSLFSVNQMRIYFSARR